MTTIPRRPCPTTRRREHLRHRRPTLQRPTHRRPPSRTDAPAPPSASGADVGGTTATPAAGAPAVFGNPAVVLQPVAEVEQPVGMAVRPGDAVPVRRRPGRHGVPHHDRPERCRAGGRGRRSDRQDQLGGRARPARDRVLVRRRAGVARLHRQRRRHRGRRVPRRSGRHVRRRRRARAVADRPAVRRTTTAAICDSAPTGCCTWRWATADRAATRSDGRAIRRRCSASCCGSIRRRSGDAPYTIPADNPFATGSMGDIAGAPEVWAWGLRNPWRIAFDPATADLWIADVGQNEIEEIDAVGPTADHPAGWGANFGWSGYEGNNRYNDDVPDPGNLIFPVWTYTHAEGCSISGGEVYRGTAIAELEPAYVYSDYARASSGRSTSPQDATRSSSRDWSGSSPCAPDPTASSTSSSTSQALDRASSSAGADTVRAGSTRPLRDAFVGHLGGDDVDVDDLDADLVTGVDVVGGHPADDRRIGDLELDSPRRPRRSRSPGTCGRPVTDSTTASARSSACRSARLARCSPRDMARGSVSKAVLISSGTALPLATASAASIT